ncbi:biotin--[acetyl-CoA-carboxylase] ligase [Labilibaculum filiforme]|uniref:Biotin--[acetyl-CoA-carboxylase] ligase n=1 Tax=Labilibaculum filiforme TaxID=1940526 RepID=A0A2N3I614_9BACT|nr:biotin--[acetyl-CoA-carboxylase] ligase [Labilibaculum filiforme]PKQ65750.1 biotin--[acetyl-CoA-carboxylase] ligase [Labilibaculum filiforme]
MNRCLFSPQLLIRKNEIHSTNNFALELIKTQKPSGGTVVLTLSQTKGRGQRTNVWESELGKNLTISIILTPEFLPIARQFQISLVISLGVYDYLRNYLKKVNIKWPNDIYVEDEKIAGILIEHSIMGSVLSHSICGLGLNINQVKFVSDAPNPTSLAICTGKEYDLDQELTKLLNCIENRYFQLEDNKSDQLEKDYLNALYWMKEKHQFSDENGQFEGEIIGITEYGQLRIKAMDEERIYNFKEVSFIH